MMIIEDDSQDRICAYDGYYNFYSGFCNEEFDVDL